MNTVKSVITQYKHRADRTEEVTLYILTATVRAITKVMIRRYRLCHPGWFYSRRRLIAIHFYDSNGKCANWYRITGNLLLLLITASKS